MKKSMKNRGATSPLYRAIAVCKLDQIRGGAIVVSDPGGAGNATGGAGTGTATPNGTVPWPEPPPVAPRP